MKRNVTRQPADPDPSLQKLLEYAAQQESARSLDSQRLGETDEYRRGRVRGRYLVIVVILFFAGLAWLWGRAREGDLWHLFRRVVAPSSQRFELVEARDGIVLIVTHNKNQSGVNVQLSGETGWRNISMADATAKRPTLSPSGTQVAYLSEQGGIHITVASLISDTQQLVTAEVIDTSLSTRALPNLNVCNWGQAQWSPDERYLGFFACATKSDVSFAVIIDLQSNPPTIIWVEDESVAQDNRSLIWLDQHNLVISTPGTNGNAATVDTVEIP